LQAIPAEGFLWHDPSDADRSSLADRRSWSPMIFTG